MNKVRHGLLLSKEALELDSPADAWLDEEHGRRARVGGRPVDVADEFAMVDLAGEVGSERAAVGMDEGSREDEGFVKIERGMRTDTEGTLVGRDEDEGEVKGLEE